MELDTIKSGIKGAIKSFISLFLLLCAVAFYFLMVASKNNTEMLIAMVLFILVLMLNWILFFKNKYSKMELDTIKNNIKNIIIDFIKGFIGLLLLLAMVASFFAMVASVIHFQILHAMGYLILMMILRWIDNAL